MNNANLVNQTSAESGFEYYTPPEWTAAAREVMGGIDLDPASCDFANEWIGAKQIFTKETDGLQQEWRGRVWMNHPFHRGETACKAKCKKLTCQRRGHHITEDIPGNTEWINKLLAEYHAGRVTEAVIICYCSSSETWFKPLLQQPQCFPDGRIHYIGEDGKKVQGNTKGSVITYFGPNVARFAEVFGKLGEVKVTYQPGDKLSGISAALLSLIEQRASELAQQYASTTMKQRPDDAEPGELVSNPEQLPEPELSTDALQLPDHIANAREMVGTDIDDGSKTDEQAEPEQLSEDEMEQLLPGTFTIDSMCEHVRAGKLPFDGVPMALTMKLYDMFGQHEKYTLRQVRTAIIAIEEPGMVTKTTLADEEQEPYGPLNPFFSGFHHEQAFYTVDAKDRITKVQQFTLEQCHTALKVTGLQSTVVKAIEARIRKLNKQEQAA